MLEKMNYSENKLNGKKIGIILVLAFVGWTICGMIMGIGLATTTEFNALILHALFVPVVFSSISYVYFNKHNYTTPLRTATIFVTFVILMDIFVVSLLINKNFDMFRSVIGTWLVFLEIFVITYLTGMLVNARPIKIGTGSPEFQIN